MAIGLVLAALNELLFDKIVCRCNLFGVKLSDCEMQLLALVAFDELAGREVAKRFEKETGRSIAYGTLYSTFRRLKEDGLVTVRDAQDEDGRIRFFHITHNGKAALNEARNHRQSLATFGLSWA